MFRVPDKGTKWFTKFALELFGFNLLTKTSRKLAVTPFKKTQNMT